MATIPLVDLPKGASARSRSNQPPVLSVITRLEPHGQAAEAFRVLRANLQFLGLDRPLKSILITSAVPAEGKSFTSANLAVVLAQTGARICMVDADLRLPTQAQMFGVESKHGLTDVLIGARLLEEVLAQPLPNLALLTSSLA